MSGSKRWAPSTAQLIAIFVLLAAVAVGALALLLEGATPSAAAETQVRTAVTLVGVLGLAATAALAYRRQDLGEQQHSLAVDRDHRDHEHTIARDLRERFTIAASQLGSESLPVRLAGVYAMAALADSWLEPRSGEPAESHRDQAQAQVCIDVLCGYLRAGDPNSPSWTIDSQVRASITRTLASKLRPEPAGPDAAIQSTSGRWSWADIDLRGAHIDQPILFRDAVLSGNLVATNAAFMDSFGLDGSTITGQCDFTGTRFTGNATSFVKTRFLNRCFFAGAHFETLTLFFKSSFASPVSFSGASFQGQTVQFLSCEFRHADADFKKSIFKCTARFTGSRFINSFITFRRSQFRAEADFHGTQFAGAAPDFRDASFDKGYDFTGSIWGESEGDSAPYSPPLAPASDSE